MSEDYSELYRHPIATAPASPFSNDALKDQVLRTTHGGEFDVTVDDKKVGAELDASVTENLSFGARFQKYYNGAVEWMGLAKYRW
jgi:FlaG/FlaF family flagellin (archaellin)